MQEILIKILISFVRWLIFSVIVALLPIGAKGLILLTMGKPVDPAALIGHGELLLVAVSLTAAAIGGLIPVKDTMVLGKLVAVGGCIIILILGCFYYAYVSGTMLAGQPIKASVVSTMSTILYVFSVVSSGGCVVLAEV